MINSFIIETCHAAALHASYSRRAKIKVDDFKFVLRKDPKKLGRVVELLQKEKEFRKARAGMDVNEGKLSREAMKQERDRAREEEKTKTNDDRKSKKRKIDGSVKG